MDKNVLIFDVETGPLPVAEIEQFKPEFRAPGNYKDLDKIKANLLEQEAKWLADGALSAITGRVLCIGLSVQNFPVFLGHKDEDEKQIVSMFWEQAALTLRGGGLLIGFCCKSFDVPFLVRRSWKLGVPVPMCIWEGRYLNSQIIDVAERWACGGREPRDRISLDHLSKFLGTGAKNGDGADFAKLWDEDRPAALDYLKNDLLLTKAAYERLFVQ